MTHHPRGFTLAETAVILAIAGVLALLALPSMTQQHTQARSASHLLGASLAGARSAAVSRRRAVSVCPVDAAGRCRSDGVWDEGWIVFADPDALGQPRGQADILRHGQAPRGLRMRSAPSRSRVRFLPQGRAAGSNVTVTVCSGHPRVDGASIIVSNVGRIRTERLAPGHPDCSGA